MSTCHKEFGVGTLYTRLGITCAHLRAVPTGSIDESNFANLFICITTGGF